MKRFFLFFLLITVSFQLSWGGVSVFNQYEIDEVIQSNWQAEIKGAGAEEEGEKKVSGRMCSRSCSCHLTAAVLPIPFMPAFRKLQEVPARFDSPIYRSPVPDGPVRPNWRALG